MNRRVSQGLPLVLTVVIFALLCFVLYLYILFLNRFTRNDIYLGIHLADILFGVTIYLKTSVDFAIFIGNLMSQFPGWRNRISIELGTAVGNALGTIVVLTIWNFFRNVEWLLALMIILASAVLVRLAQDGLEHAQEAGGLNVSLNRFVNSFRLVLTKINSVLGKGLNLIIPNLSLGKTSKKLSWGGLFLFSFTIPFILGLDDFAGYVPLFNIINVFGFAIGVFAGHTILNIFLFLSPGRTIRVVKNPYISLVGSIFFIGLALWGLYEAVKLIEIYFH